MKTINVPVAGQVSTESQQLLDQVKRRFGKVPNLYATVGYSSNALRGFIEFDDNLNRGIFTPIEKEAIALVVSEINECNYCLAAHTMTSSMKGIPNDEILSMRRGEVSDSKINVLVHLAKSIVENKGEVEEVLIENFYNAGYSDSALIELIGLITVRIFTNYVIAITGIPIDFPLAQSLV